MEENKIVDVIDGAVDEAADGSGSGVIKAVVKFGTYVLAGLAGWGLNELRHRGLPKIGGKKNKDRSDEIDKEFDDDGQED